jgi:hypothetical protein
MIGHGESYCGGSQSIKIIICESHANFFYDLISGRGGEGAGGGRFFISIDTLQNISVVCIEI